MIESLRTFRPLASSAALAALLCMGTGYAGIAHAESPAGQAPPSQPATDVSDEQLNQFVEAATEVQTVQQEYAAEIQSTSDAEQAQTLRAEAQEKMVEAVESSGLSVSEYNLIAQQLQQDPSLANRLNEMQGQ